MRPLPWAMSPPNTPRPARRSACWCAARPCRPRPAPFPSSPNATPSKETTRMTVRYTKDQEWVRLDGEVATIGISDYAQSQLGDVVFVDLPAPGKKVADRKSTRLNYSQ